MQEELENLAAQYERDKALWNDKEKETCQLRIDNKFFAEENRTLKAMLETERDDYTAIKEEKMHLESYLVEFQNQQKDAQQILEEENAQLKSELDSKMQELQHTLQRSSRWQSTMQAALKERDAKLEEKQGQIVEFQDCLEKNEACINAMRDEMQELRQKLERIQQESLRTILALQGTNEGLQRQVRSLQGESKKKIEETETQLWHEQEHNKALQAELEEFELVAKKMLDLERRVSARDGAASAALHEAKTRCADAENRLSALQEQHSKSQKRMADLLERLEDAEEELSVLQGKVPSAVALGKLASALVLEARKSNASYEMIALAAATERVAIDMEEGMLDLEPSGCICTASDLRLVQQGFADICHKEDNPPETGARLSKPRRHPLHEQDGNSASLEQQYAEAKLNLVHLSAGNAPASAQEGVRDD